MSDDGRFRALWDSRAVMTTYILGLLTFSNPELLGVARKIRRVAFRRPQTRWSSWPPCQRLNATYTHITPRTACPRGPRFGC